MAKNNSKEKLENELNYTNFNLEFNNKLIVLTSLNVQKVETMLRYNPDYPQFFDYNLLNDSNYVNNIIEKVKFEKEKKNKKAEFEYPSFYYIKALEKNHNDPDFKYYIEAILRRINSENSTRASKDDITKIADEIVKQINKKCENDNTKAYDTLINELKNQNKEYKIIKYIWEKGSKHYLSLATKFCHYMSFILFFGTEDADTYSIFDSVLKDNLKYYANPLGVDLKYTPQDFKSKKWEVIRDSYDKYQKTIAEIIEKVNISRNGFDHLVWYSNKKFEDRDE